MLAFNENTWTKEQEIPTQLNRQHDADELERERIFNAEAIEHDEEDDLEDDDLDLDDDDLDLEDDEDLDDDDDLDDDVVPGYDEDLDDEDEDIDDPLRAEIDEDDDLLPDLDNNDEIPEREEADTETLGYPSEQEVSQPQEGSDASYSEQTDVTPPRPHEFPSEGSPKTDFTSRNQGRTTGRMLGHEPGTEGI